MHTVPDTHLLGKIAHFHDVTFQRIQIKYKTWCLDFGLIHPHGSWDIISDLQILNFFTRSFISTSPLTTALSKTTFTCLNPGEPVHINITTGDDDTNASTAIDIRVAQNNCKRNSTAWLNNQLHALPCQLHCRDDLLLARGLHIGDKIRHKMPRVFFEWHFQAICNGNRGIISNDFAGLKRPCYIICLLGLGSIDICIGARLDNVRQVPEIIPPPPIGATTASAPQPALATLQNRLPVRQSRVDHYGCANSRTGAGMHLGKDRLTACCRRFAFSNQAAIAAYRCLLCLWRRTWHHNMARYAPYCPLHRTG